MRRLFALAFAVAVLASACGGGGSSNPRRLVQVDYRSDEFGSHFWRFFPHSIDAHPGDTVDFHQTWTGEPHTVTLGTIVDAAVPRIAALEQKYAGKDSPSEEKAARAEYEAVLKDLPVFDPYKDAAAQNAVLPCSHAGRSRNPPSTDAIRTTRAASCRRPDREEATSS
jgi:hypothetical protein